MLHHLAIQTWTGLLDDIRGKLLAARKEHKHIAILNMKNDVYKRFITEGAKAVAKDHNKSSASSKAEALGAGLLNTLMQSGKKHFFVRGGDDREMSHHEVLDSKSVS